MSKLPTPIGEALREGFDELDVQRVWRGIQARSAASSTRYKVRHLALPIAALAMLAVMWLFGTWVRPVDRQGPLEVVSGGMPPVLLAVAQERAVDLSDGSRIVLASGAALDVLSNDGGMFLTLLRRGRTTFEVRPAGRQWVIECGLATVEVVGTTFSITRDPDRLEVAVERGTVIVRSERVLDRVQRLSAGEHLTISPPPVKRAPAPDASTQPDPGSTQAEPPPDAGTEEEASTVGSTGRKTAVPASGVKLGAPRQGRDPIDELVRRADAARAAGNVPRAAALLERVVDQAEEGDPRAALAALTLARLTMGKSPERASQALSRALDAAPQGLEEDVLARLVEARARAGDRDGAREAARLYERTYPSGARQAEVKRWAAE